MKQYNIKQQQHLMGWAYLFMFFALFTVVTGLIAYILSAKVSQMPEVEVWIHAQALWVMRNILLFTVFILFASLWFIPLFFYAYNAMQWVTACTIIGIVFIVIAWLFLLNSFIQGIPKFMKNKAVF